MEQERKVKEMLEEPELSLDIFFEDEPMEMPLDAAFDVPLEESTKEPKEKSLNESDESSEEPEDEQLEMLLGVPFEMPLEESMEGSSDEPEDEQLEMLLGGHLRQDLQTLEPRDVVNLPASNDSDSDNDSMNTDGTIYATSNSFSDGIFLLGDNWAVMWQSMPRYSFKCQQLIECPSRRQPKTHIFDASMQSRLHLVARNFNLLTVVSYPRSDVDRRLYWHHQVWSYTPATNRWKLDEGFKHNMLALQEMRIKAFMNTDGNELVIYFEDDEYPRIEKGFVVRSIDGTNAIFRADEGVLPRAGYDAAYVSHQHFMYVIGGTLNLIPVCDVHRYDFHKRLWQVLYQSDQNNPFDFPKGRFGHKVITDGKFIYCLGGGDIDMQFHDFKHILSFNLTTHTWLEHHTQPDDRMLAENEGYPRARQDFACVQRRCSNGDIEAIICGGLGSLLLDYNSEIRLSDIWKLNLCTMKWTHLLTARTPLPTYISPAALMRNDCLFVFGGVESKNWAPGFSVMGLYKMWLTVPKLSELAWEAYSYYNDLKGRDRQELITLGIPSRFVERLPPVEPSP